MEVTSVANDYLALLREQDERDKKEREAVQEERAGKLAALKEYEEAWNTVISELELSERENLQPNFSCFITLARVLESRGYAAWLDEMAANFAMILNDRHQYRPAQLFFTQLLVIARDTKNNAISRRKLLLAYDDFVPSDPPPSWRANGARDVCDYMSDRIEKFRRDQSAKAARAEAEAAEVRIQELRQAAQRRPAIEKQLFAVNLADKGLRPAAIRDQWNQAHPKDLIEGGEPGRDDIKKAISRGREFLQENETTLAEIATVLALALP